MEKEYTVLIEETLSKRIKVKAKSEVEALEKVEKEYYDSNIILSADDFEAVVFSSKNDE